jgi:chromate transporter
MPETAAPSSAAPPPGAPASAPPPDASPQPPIPSHAELFLAFVRITLSGFGGTLPWTRRMFVERKKWMTAEEFNNNYALCQFLPGPNIVNLTAIFGWRMRGVTGALACWSGFLLVPFLIMLTLGMLYARYGDVDALRRILGGIAAAAAGLMISTMAKMAAPMFKRLSPAPFMLIATALAIGVLRWPLVWVMLVLAPSSVVLAAWWGRR